jgi:hypothetical protein
MLVKNINGTGKRLPEGYRSWQHFWEVKTGEKAKHNVGGHVKKAYSSDNSWYIADITYTQNAKMEPYEYNGKLAKLHD